MSTTASRRILSIAAAVAGRYPSRVHPLAAPPAGSGLKPVMGDYGAPFIGHALTGMIDPLGTARERFDRFGPVSWSGAYGMKVVNLTGPEAIEVAWANKNKAFSSEQGWEPLIGPFFRRGIMLLDFDEHLYHRRILQQAFTRQRLAGYLDLMTPGIERDLYRWRPADGFPVYANAKRMLLNLATEVFVGAPPGGEATRLEHAFEDAVKGGQAVVRADVPGGTWSRGLRGRRYLQEYFRAQLPAKRAAETNDLFSVLCHSRSEDGHAFTDEDVVNHMIFVLMAAHDTSTIALSMLTYLLGQNPVWQHKLRAEAQALGTSTMSYDDLDRLPLLDLAFKETLRMYAPAGMLFRKTVKDTEILGHYIPAGTEVGIGAYPSMRLQRWWPDPDTFDPERFADARRDDKVHRYAWSPFGGGAHKCIGLYFGGMTVKAIMYQMLSKYRWTVRADYQVPIEWGTGPTPSDGLPIRLEHLPVPRIEESEQLV